VRLVSLGTMGQLAGEEGWGFSQALGGFGVDAGEDTAVVVLVLGVEDVEPIGDGNVEVKQPMGKTKVC